MAYTFATLARSDKRTLDRVMKQGEAPAIDDVIGFEFRGWNLNATTRIFGTRKFKKGMFGEPGSLEARGYNVEVKQNDFEEPWIAEPSEENPRRYAFYKVFPASAAKRPRYPRSLIVDYRASGEYFVLNPVGYTVDFLVYPNPGDTDLILGKSYFQGGFLQVFLGYFVLERIAEPSGYQPTRTG